MKSILLFGDSNSWGYMPNAGTRYPLEQRWPGIASKLLGGEYNLIEENISGRTTVFEDPRYPNRCGLGALGYSLCANYPLDMVVLFLGTNDLKFTDAAGFGRGLAGIVHYVLDAQSIYKLDEPVFVNNSKKILIVGPPRINAEIVRFRPDNRLSGAAKESQKLSSIAKEVAERTGCWFVDVAEIAYPEPPDCLHLSCEAHRKIAEVIAGRIREIFEEKRADPI